MRLQDIVKEAIDPNIKFKRIDDSEGDNNRGWQVDKIVALLDGEEIGYLKMSYVPSKRLKKWYPTIFSFLDQIEGQHILPQEYRFAQVKDIPTDVLRKRLFYAQQIVEGYVSYDEQKQNEQLSDEEVRAKFNNLEKAAKKKFKKKWNDFVNFHVDKPLVDFIRVEPEFKRQGIGTALYRAGHQWMKEKGMKLYASGLQTTDAKLAWQSLEKKFPIGREKGSFGRDKYERRYFADEEV